MRGGPIQHGFLLLELPNQTLHLGAASVEDPLDPFEEYDTIQRFEVEVGRQFDHGLVALGQEAGVECGTAKAGEEIPLPLLHPLADGSQLGVPDLPLPLQNHEYLYLDQRQPIGLPPALDIRV